MSGHLRTSAFLCLLLFVGSAMSRGRILNPVEKVEVGGEGDAGAGYGDGDGDVEATTMRPTQAVSRETVERMRLILKDRYLRSPLAVVVDTEPIALEYTKRLWQETFRGMDGEGINLVLLPFNSSGMSNAYLTKGILWFGQMLEGVAPVPVTRPGVGGVAFYSILKATEQIPFDSAILVFTGRPPVDEYLAQLATATLIQKRCKLHVVWCAPSTSVSSGGAPGAEALFHEVIERTGGEFHATGFDNRPHATATRKPPNRGADADADGSVATPLGEQEMILAMRRELVGSVQTPFSVDSTVHKIHVTIDGAVSAAVLRTPTGASIDLRSPTALGDSTSGGANVLASTASRLDVELDTSAATPGVWTLATASDRPHDVVVAAHSRLAVSAAIFGVAADDREDADAPGNGSALLRLTLVGVGRVDSVALVDAQGKELRRLAYQRRQDDALDAHDAALEPDQQVTTDLDLPGDLRLPQNAFVMVSGMDPTGAAFSRVSALSSRRQDLASPASAFVAAGTSVVGPVTVGVSANTSLHALPNTWHSLVFTVTNNRNTPTLYRFGARDDRGYIRNVLPTQVYIGGRLTYNVVVGILAPAATPYGSTDTVTLVVQGPSDLTNKSAIITIGDKVVDTQRPHIEHSIKTNCRGYTEPTNCRTRIWNAEIEIIDRDAGVLDVISQPPGIRFMTDFISGTKSTITAYYSATCCENKVDITVTDTNGNYVKYFINGDDTLILRAGEIAAIVCGCLLLIILILCIILAVCICKKNRSKSHDLPVHPRARHN